MSKTILITGSTDGIGLETAKMLSEQGHTVLLHGRNSAKLESAETTLAAVLPSSDGISSYQADLSRMQGVEKLATEVASGHTKLDVLINNAGVYMTPHSTTVDGLDVRFVVNTFAPYFLTERLLPLLGSAGRVINLSSAAQATVDLSAMAGQRRIDDMTAYAQSKLALTMWSQEMGLKHKDTGPVFIAVNPGSLLASKMVKEGFGVDGSDLRIGADILCRAALADEFADKSGQYFDNDIGKFSAPHSDALDATKSARVVEAIKEIVSALEV
ncbi:MAG: SDR family NAD(P)-dependent oxidoreductase [Pseudomonadota bacterium]